MSSTARFASSWQKNLFLCSIPVFPICYLAVHGVRMNTFPLSKFYVSTSQLQPSEQLRELVDEELDTVKGIERIKLRVCLTDETHPKTYGCFALKTGAEIQLPVRVSFEDVEHARRLGANLELDMGLASHRRKIVVSSATGEEIVERMLLSDAAKHFLVQSQLQLIKNNHIFVVPCLVAFAVTAMGYPIYLFLLKYLAMPWAVGISLAIVWTSLWQFLVKHFEYKIQYGDEETVKMGEYYAQGAIDYFEASLQLNQLLRTVLGEDGEKCITPEGDCKLDKVPLTERLKNVKKLFKRMKKEAERKRILELREAANNPTI